MTEFLKTLGPQPLHNPAIPSCLIILEYASVTLVYLRGTSGGKRPSACNLTLTTSVGLAMVIPIAPVVKPAKIFLVIGGSPWKSFPQ